MKGRSQARTGSEITADAEDRLRERGGGRFPTFTLQPDEMARWRALEAAVGGPERGRSKRTLLAAMAALEGQDATDWPAELRRLAAELER